jgi:hypothetical protein
MNNIKYNIIIVIFVLIFIGYFYLENNFFKYKNVKKTQEHFQSNNISNTQVKTLLVNVFSNVKSINSNMSKVNDNNLDIQNFIKKNEFVFFNIVNNKQFKNYLNKTISELNKNNKLYNDTITILGSQSSVNFLLKLSNFFATLKRINNDYRVYYNSDFTITEDNMKQNDKILENKIEVEKKLIKHHSNIDVIIINILEELKTYSLSKNVFNFLLKFLVIEKEKNKLQKDLLESDGLFTTLNNFNNFYKKEKKITKLEGKQLNNINIKRKEIISAISLLLNNQNQFIDDGLNFNLFEEEKKDKEIEYLYSANNNNNLLANFCKKIKKLDKPSEGNLITKRLHKEFKNKKGVQIKKLEAQIDILINSMTENQLNKYNSHVIRTHDQASKQYSAIKKAKENLDNAKKLKINVS